MALLAWVTACGQTPPCPTTGACPAATSCQADGVCAPLDPNEARFAQVRWLPAADYGVTRRDTPLQGPPDTDVLGLGGRGDAEAYVLFRPLPRDVGVVRAVLAVSPHETWPGSAETRTLAVDSVAPFVGAQMTRWTSPRPTGGAIAERPVSPAARRIRIDVTEAVARVLESGGQTFAVRLRSAGGDGGPLWLASPRAIRADTRPRLEIWLR